jgi:hypothetical protein
MRQLIAAVDVIVPRREPHIDAIHDRGRLADPVADGDTGDQQRNAEQS